MMQGSPGFGDGGAFRAIFFEEAREHLAGTEEILLRLDTDAPDPDDLNAIFRAVHSIKGSAAMLGFDEIAALTHVLENLLDLLRKGERAIAKADVDAMLEAGDIVKSQVAHHLGLLAEAPDSSAAQAFLRERVAFAGTAVASAGPASRCFNVRLGPLAGPIDAAELDMMLAGLAEMGALRNQAVDNSAGGLVCFELTLEGTEFDLRSVLSLVVPPEQIDVQVAHQAAAGASAPAPAPKAAPVVPASAPVRGDADELFVDPVEFKRARQTRPAAEGALTAPQTAAAVQTAIAPVPGRQGADPASSAVMGTSSLRVATEKIDKLVNLVGELVITESMLSRQGALFDQQAGHGAPAGLADLARHTRDLQEMVLAIRMVPINDGFARIPRLVRELSARLGKQVELRTSGEATELDRGLIEKLSDPLLHLVRNAVDHGLETPEVRIEAGKPPVGLLRLMARQRGGKVVIEVSDDGRGLDRERILERARQRGRIFAASASDP
jgi:two-component system, chemotaxis family, sensor kinase CheA